MSANIDSNNRVRQLDRRAEPDEQVLEDQVQDPPRLVRLLMTLLRDVARLKRRWSPRHVDFEDRVVASGGDLTRFNHKFNGRVRWWVVGWQGSGGHYNLDEDTTTDANTLVLASYAGGTVTIRIEEAG